VNTGVTIQIEDLASVQEEEKKQILSMTKKLSESKKFSPG